MATPSVTGTPQSFNFTTSGTVVTYTGGGATGADVYDVLCVNSDNVVTTPSGWTAAVPAVNNQGAYIFVKAENGTTSATLALGGGIASPTAVEWLRVRDSAGLDTGASGQSQANAAISNTTPAFTSSALAASTELALAFAALHGFTAGTPTGTAWSTGYTEQANATNGVNAPAVYGSVAVKVPAGTAAESPSFSWTNSTTDRYMLFVAFQPSAGVSAVTPTGIAASAALGSPTVALNRSAAPTGIAATVALGTPSVTSVTPAPTGISVSVSLGTPSVSLNRSAAPSGISATVALGAPAAVIVSTPGGISVSALAGSPSVSATVLTAGAPGSWWGLKATDDLNLSYLAEERRAPVECPNDGEPLQRNPRTGKLQCAYDGWVAW